MTDHAERAFAATFLNIISSQPVIFNDDYQQPLPYSLKRVPVLPTPIPPPPAAKKQLQASDASGGAIQIIFKSIKPHASYTLSVQPTDTVGSIKSQLAETHLSAPPADAQRLLLKGKALADTKLLQEYTIQDGNVITLMIKPGVEWDPNTPRQPPKAAAPSASKPFSSFSSSPSTLSVDMVDATTTPGQAPQRKHKHQRIPSVVLSPSPSTSTVDLLVSVDGTPSSNTQEKDILLTLDSTDVPQPIHPEIFSTYHDTAAQPEYWSRLLQFLRSEFTSEPDAVHAFEDYLRATKASLTANEIAKIRDYTGIVGMAGT